MKMTILKEKKKKQKEMFEETFFCLWLGGSEIACMQHIAVKEFTAYT